MGRLASLYWTNVGYSLQILSSKVKLGSTLKICVKRIHLSFLQRKNLSDISASPELANTVRENCPTQIYLPNPKATAEGIKQQYINFGLNSRQIELLSELTQKREYYVSSIKGNRVFDLALQPLEAAFVTATSKEDQLKIQSVRKKSSI